MQRDGAQHQCLLPSFDELEIAAYYGSRDFLIVTLTPSNTMAVTVFLNV